ncbi:hypothetical protein J2W55_001461 [Mucilaginibacter pocheonensis]|uniref:Uncharacterized protein n=1 Tax=Mucilaginibacter pocheonensis TaxID=398050 RepID=A0ABU1T899_9SPHI|nr:hypothetical protein [Mucilaginibacter pocheonensis]
MFKFINDHHFNQYGQDTSRPGGMTALVIF